MLKVTDRIFGWLLVLASCGHTVGTVMWIPFMSGMFIWSLGSSLAAGLLATLNLLRVERPEDTTLAIITATGSACWVFIALGFGKSIDNMLDSRALMHAVTASVLVLFSINTLRHSSPHRFQRLAG